MTPAQRTRLISDWYDGVSYIELARRFGVSKTAVENILQGLVRPSAPKLRLKAVVRKVRGA